MPEINLTIILFNSFPEAMVLAWLCLSLVGLRPGFRQILLIGCFQALFDVFLFLVVGKLILIPFGVHTVIQAAVFAVIIQRVMRIPYKNSFLAVVFGFTVYVCIEMLMLSLTIVVTANSIPVVQEDNWWHRMPYFISQMMVNLLVIFLIRRFNFRFAEGWANEKNNSFFWLSGLLFTQSLLIVLLCWRYYQTYKEMFNFLTPIHLSFVVGNGLLPVVTMSIISQFMVLFRREIETKAQLDTFRHVEELLHTMRAQRHDFTHELQVVYGLLEVQAFQEARDYLKQSVDEVSATSELVKTDNLGVTALLYTKTGLAEARKIVLHISVETSLQQFRLEARDINLILGNLIDNALDAADQLPALQRKVWVFIAQGLEGYVMEVENYGPPIPPEEVEQIFAPGFSTKGEGRGMGLYSIQKLVHKYNGDIRVTSGHNSTTFRVVIPTDQADRRPQMNANKFGGRWGKWLY
jgi:two-component system, LytTR family, sensor histidine kinase AgrC